MIRIHNACEDYATVIIAVSDLLGRCVWLRYHVFRLDFLCHQPPSGLYHQLNIEKSADCRFVKPYKSVILARVESFFLGADVDYDTDGLWRTRIAADEVWHDVDLVYYLNFICRSIKFCHSMPTARLCSFCNFVMRSLERHCCEDLKGLQLECGMLWMECIGDLCTQTLCHKCIPLDSTKQSPFARYVSTFVLNSRKWMEAFRFASSFILLSIFIVKARWNLSRRCQHLKFLDQAVQIRRNIGQLMGSKQRKNLPMKYSMLASFIMESYMKGKS